jgi:hypothetical protein
MTMISRGTLQRIRGRRVPKQRSVSDIISQKHIMIGLAREKNVTVAVAWRPPPPPQSLGDGSGDGRQTPSNGVTPHGTSQAPPVTVPSHDHVTSVVLGLFGPTAGGKGQGPELAQDGHALVCHILFYL